MKVYQIASEIEKIAPLGLAQGWDNVGLLVGSKNDDVKNILLTIDITKDVLEEAKKLKTDLIISYHPLIWDGLKKITPDDSSAVVYELIRSGINVFSIHTALDVVTGGINDALAEIIGIKNPSPIGDYVVNPDADNYKLVVFIPVDAVAKVSMALFAAGAGFIGNYSDCSFQLKGQGTFLPLEGANPAIGKKGKFEKIEEVRFETIVPAAKIEKVVAAMRKAHPYETPAFDVIKLSDVEKIGLGRMGELDSPKPLSEIIEQVKKQTGASAVGVIGKEKRTVKKAAVCAGSCGKIINLVISGGCDLYLTGELKHHQALAAQEAGLTCLCLTHTVSERFMLKKLAQKLQRQLEGLTIKVSKKDADPFNWKNI